MNNQFILNSIGIGGAIFVGLIIFWFVFIYLKRRMILDSSTRSVTAAMQVSWEEKRHHPRIEIEWPAVIEGARPNAEVQLKDISLGGAFVVCPEPPELQDQFKIAIDLPEVGAVSFNAVMVWSNFNIPREKVVNRGMGIKFIANEQKKRLQLQDAIAAALEKIDSRQHQ